MKRIYLLFMVATSVVMFSCGGGSQAAKEAVENTGAVCIWENVPLKEAPDESGKWVCSISIGEVLTYLDDSKEYNSGKKTIKCYKVKLKDGKEGWAQSDFIILNSKAAVITDDIELYSRPDLLNKTNRTFSKMDIIAIKSEKDGFLEVEGKRKGGKWIESGWLKGKTISYDAVDIAVAKFATKALSISDRNKREQAIKEILENSDFKSSVFIASLSKPEPGPADNASSPDSVK
jgi:hypothetical protein